MPFNTLTSAKDKSSKKTEALPQAIRRGTSILHQRTRATSIQFDQRDPRSIKPEDIVQLQKSVGNQAVVQLFKPSTSSAYSASSPQITQKKPVNHSLALPIQRPTGFEEGNAWSMKPNPIVVQRQGMENEEPMQGKFEPIQRHTDVDMEKKLMPRQFNTGISAIQPNSTNVPEENRTSLPRQLKTGLETLSGMDLSSVRVHHNSAKPRQVNALAYTQRRDIHLGPGQEQHLPHEGWHVVQQLQGRVKATIQAKGVSINADEQLEREADEMGLKALKIPGGQQTKASTAASLRMRHAPTHISAVSGDSFEKQPAELRNLIKPSSEDPEGWFNGLPPEEKIAMTSIFNRLAKYRLLSHVLFIQNVVAGETPATLWDLRFKVAGSTPSIYFLTPYWQALWNALLATGHFCMAYGTGNSYHPEQTSLREISGSDSLHISIGPGNQVDAHIDKFSPVKNHPGSSFCPNTPSPAAIGHFGREAFPETIRKLMRSLREKVDFVPVLPRLINLPGLELFPEPQPMTRPPGLLDFEPRPEIFRITWRGPLKKKRRRKSTVASLPDHIVNHLAAEIPKRIQNNALVPSGAKQQLEEATLAAKKAGRALEGEFGAVREEAREHLESFAPAHSFALDLAKEMAQASRSDRQDFIIQHGQLYGKMTSADYRHVLNQIQNIARIVRGLLAKRARGVNKVWVMFGDVMWDINF